jgi:hypothetical protein
MVMQVGSTPKLNHPQKWQPMNSGDKTLQANDYQPTQAEQNGCRQRLEGYLSCQQRLALAVA